jgi:hypothetical protein
VLRREPHRDQAAGGWAEFCGQGEVARILRKHGAAGEEPQ